MAEKVTSMIIKVDLQCPSCYKKVKKILCKFPQIRDQVYDEKQNLVKIKVVCCSPEKIRDKLSCMGGKVIQSIEIEKPPETKENPKKPDPPTCVILPHCCGRPPACVFPPPPPPCYCNYGYGYGCWKGCYVSRCDYFVEDNTGGCTIM